MGVPLRADNAAQLLAGWSTADREDTPGQATCEGGEHLPMIGLVGATLARTIQDFLGSRERRDSLISLSGVMRTA
jgi:hypothetical protein